MRDQISAREHLVHSKHTRNIELVGEVTNG